jgi:hypothetical protein
MVNEVRKKTLTVYVCELCGFAYGDLETAEDCEQYCYSHGHNSRKITKCRLQAACSGYEVRTWASGKCVGS